MKHARAAGGDIKVCALENDVRALLEMTRLNKVLDVHATRQEAIAAWTIDGPGPSSPKS
jgi:anti-anti-sigma regulatory factor